MVFALMMSGLLSNGAAAKPHPRAENSKLFAGESEDLRDLAVRAYVWGMPLVEAAMIRSRFVSGRGMLNQFSHRRQLAGPEMRAGVGPNNDTIYTLAWVDLSDGPLVLSMPDFGNRYYTISINQADSSSDQSFGQRTHGGQLPPLFIHDRNCSSPTPAGMVSVPVSTRFANLAARILVKDASDAASVHPLQNKITLIRWSDWQAGNKVAALGKMVPALLLESPGQTSEFIFLERLGHVLKDWSPRDDAERSIISSLEALGIDPLHGFDPARLNPRDHAAVLAGIAEGRALVERHSRALGTQVNGWMINYTGPRFDHNYLLRAAVAKDQIFVAVPEEAIYPVARVDARGKALTGRHRYRIRFAPGRLPPVGAFWSVTAYDDQGFMVPNAMNRYSVGDRTKDIVRDHDGGITIQLSKIKPKKGLTINWLPIGNGKFYLMLRLYIPKPEARSGEWVPPPIVPIR